MPNNNNRQTYIARWHLFVELYIYLAKNQIAKLLFSDISGLCQISQEEWVICRIFHKTTGGADHKKTPLFYPHNPMCASPNPNSLFQYLDFRTLENPILHSPQNHQQPSNNLHYQSEPDVGLFPLPPLPLSPFQSDIINTNEEIAPTPPNWLESFLQSSFLYDSIFVGPNSMGGASESELIS